MREDDALRSKLQGALCGTGSKPVDTAASGGPLRRQLFREDQNPSDLEAGHQQNAPAQTHVPRDQDWSYLMRLATNQKAEPEVRSTARGAIDNVYRVAAALRRRATHLAGAETAMLTAASSTKGRMSPRRPPWLSPLGKRLAQQRIQALGGGADTQSSRMKRRRTGQTKSKRQMGSCAGDPAGNESRVTAARSSVLSSWERPPWRQEEGRRSSKTWTKW